MSTRRRVPTPLARILVVAGLVFASATTAVVTAAPAGASGQLWNGASRAHPYSRPVWWPLPGAGTVVDCYHGNGAKCQTPTVHDVYAFDVMAPHWSSMPVYAMGAGIVKINSNGWRCNPHHGRGNYLTIDHGNGITTEYGHLGRIYVHTGDYVTPQTKLAAVGQSGYSTCAKKPYVRYVWVALRKDHKYVDFFSSYTCINGRRVQWPQQLPNHATNDWNKVPAGTRLPTSNRRCAPTTPHTPVRATGASLVRAGTASLRMSWHAPRAADHVTTINVQLQQYHPSIHRWLDLRKHVVSARATATRFGNLPRGRQFRARVWLGNHAGWAAPSAWNGASTP